MKSKVISINFDNKDEIDWNIVQLLEYNGNSKDARFIVITQPDKKTINNSFFCGIVIASLGSQWKIGHISYYWVKSCFKLLPKDQGVILSN